MNDSDNLMKPFAPLTPQILRLTKTIMDTLADIDK
jgi:hypothetical protein